jgi:hypothetical protein
MDGSASTLVKVSVVGEATAGEIRLSAEALAAAAGVTPAGLARLVRLGLVEPLAPGSGEFGAREAARLRRMLRLRADLGVNLAGAAVIVDLLERLERLEAELALARQGRA